jgi:hypothetical protein
MPIRVNISTKHRFIQIQNPVAATSLVKENPHGRIETQSSKKRIETARGVNKHNKRVLAECCVCVCVLKRAGGARGQTERAQTYSSSFPLALEKKEDVRPQTATKFRGVID